MVIYLPSPSRETLEPRKWDARARAGVFAGYVQSSAHKWTTKYQVWDLTAFVKSDLHAGATHKSQKIGRPQIVRRCMLPVDDATGYGRLVFPLKRTYDRLNSDLGPLLLLTDPEDRAPEASELLADWGQSLGMTDIEVVHQFDHTSNDGLLQLEDLQQETESLRNDTSLEADNEEEVVDLCDQGYLTDVIYSNRDQFLERIAALQQHEESLLNVEVNDQMQVIRLCGNAEREGWRLGDVIVGLNF